MATELELKDRVVVVTGSSRGIGRRIAESFLREGCNVVLAARDPGALATARGEFEGLGGGQIMTHAADLTDERPVNEMAAAVVDRFGGIDVLVCNLGGGRSVPTLAEDGAEWGRVLGLNLVSASLAVNACLPKLREGASIVLVSSIAGREAIGAPATYAAAKAALDAYCKNVSRPLAARGVRINAVSPGNIIFDGSVWDRRLREDEEATKAMLEREVPMRRFGTPDEVADAVLFLASSRASFITGSLLVVDGGQTRSI